MRKKFLAMFLIIVLSCSMVLAGCKKGKGSGGDEDESPIGPGAGGGTVEWDYGWIDNPAQLDTITTHEDVDTKLTVYEGPSYRSDTFYEWSEKNYELNISVEDEPLFVYVTKVNHRRTFIQNPQTYTTFADAPYTYFDFEGEVEIKINIPDRFVNSAIVRPLDLEVEPTISDDGHTISFTINRASPYVVEYNYDDAAASDDYKTAIHIFANEIEKDAPDPENLPDNMIYFGPGVHKVRTFSVSSGQEIYIAGGALVYGRIYAVDAQEITIRGRGILDGSIYDRWTETEAPINLTRCSYVTVDGIILSNPAAWNLNIYFSDSINVNNLKIIASRENSDGITIQSSHNVLVTNSFVRTWDDSLVVKNYERGTTKNIMFNNVYVWTDLAQSMEVGYETNGVTMENINFRNITVLHAFHLAAMSIHNADDAAISGVKYNNITVEDAQMTNSRLFETTIVFNSTWSSTPNTVEGRGTINNVTLDNVKVVAGVNPTINISGYNADRRASNINIKNVGGLRDFTSNSDISINASNTSNVNVSFTAAPTGAILTADKYEATSAPAEITVIDNLPDQQYYIVPDFAVVPAVEMFAGANRAVGSTATATTSTSGHEAQKAVDGNKESYWQSDTVIDTNATETRQNLDIDLSEEKRINNIKIRQPATNPEMRVTIFVYGATDANPDTWTLISGNINLFFDPTLGNVDGQAITPTRDYRYYRFQFRMSTLGRAMVGELELYPSNLALGRSITAANYQDVYTPDAITDGRQTTYWEGRKGSWPNDFTLDLAAQYDITVIVMALPPMMAWETRTQEIEIAVSTNGTTFTTIVAKTAYVFNPAEGNIVEIRLPTAAAARYIKFTGHSNTAWPAFQMSEVLVYDDPWQ